MPTATAILDGQDLSGQYMLITGANQGIGFETARALALRGAHVTLACRSQDSAEQAMDAIRQEKKDAQLSYINLNLCSLNSVEQCAKEYLDLKMPLNVLILNAGTMLPTEGQTKDGFETTFQVNHLAQFHLTNLLTELMASSAPARVVVVSSSTHRFARLPSDSTKWWNAFSPAKRSDQGTWKAYGYSKMANVMFASELNRRMQIYGLQAISCHPGTIKTAIARNIPQHIRRLLCCFQIALISPEEGAATSVYCATTDITCHGGKYFAKCRVSKMASVCAKEDNARKFWSLSEEMLKAKPDCSQSPTTISLRNTSGGNDDH
uniref:Uncharacterized protein n=1 Tax=Plectus sambesii TaxID=2011161 RepID=A0A914XLZ3_9BILA